MTKGVRSGSVAVLLLWLFLRGTDLAGILAELRRADYRWVLLFAAQSLFANLQRAWRWQYLLKPIKTVGVRSLTSAIFIGVSAMAGSLTRSRTRFVADDRTRAREIPLRASAA